MKGFEEEMSGRGGREGEDVETSSIPPALEGTSLKHRSFSLFFHKEEIEISNLDDGFNAGSVKNDGHKDGPWNKETEFFNRLCYDSPLSK